MIPLEVYFQFKIHFKLELFQNGVCWVRFCPGLTNGGGLPA
jgi:hypothetical protein